MEMTDVQPYHPFQQQLWLSQQVGTWQCGSCSRQNPAAAVLCGLCQRPRPSGQGGHQLSTTMAAPMAGLSTTMAEPSMAGLSTTMAGPSMGGLSAAVAQHQ